jgi:hypothetical protein
LQPSVPAAAIDLMMVEASLGSGVGPRGEVWMAYTLQSGHRYGHLFVADLKAAWTARPSQLGFDKSAEFWTFESNDPKNIVHFSESSPLILKVGVAVKFDVVFNFSL